MEVRFVFWIEIGLDWIGLDWNGLKGQGSALEKWIRSMGCCRTEYKNRRWTSYTIYSLGLSEITTPHLLHTPHAFFTSHLAPLSSRPHGEAVTQARDIEVWKEHRLTGKLEETSCSRRSSSPPPASQRDAGK